MRKDDLVFAALSAAKHAADGMPDAVAAWLGEHVDPQTGYVVDSSLSIEGAAADAKAAGDAIGDLTNTINTHDEEIVSLIGGNGYVSLPFSLKAEGTGIANGTGEERTGVTSVATDYVYVQGLAQIKYARRHAAASGSTSSTTLGMAFYTAGKTYISGQAQLWNAETASYVETTIRVPSNAAYARFTLFPSSVVPYADFYVQGYNNSQKFILSQRYNNLWAVGNINAGYAVKANNGDLAANADYDATDYIPVTGLTKIYGSGARYWFYDSEKAIISGKTGILNDATELIENSGIHVIAVPDTAAYFRICATKASEKTLYSPTPYDRYLESIVLKNRKLYCLGDSITRGMYAEVGASSSSGPTPYGYPYWIGQVTGYTVVNLGNSGSGWANVGSAETVDDTSVQRNAKDVVDDNTFSDADIITLAYGVNDWKGAAQNVVLGDMTSTSGDGTVIGNMKYCIEQIASKKPTAQIIILLPLNTNRQWTGMATMTEANNWAFGYAYRNDQTLQDYRNAIKTCADYYNVKVVDLEEVCPINRLNIRSVCGDGLHPTKAFHKQMGLALAPLIC